MDSHADVANTNTTAIEAISERLAEVTALAEQLDRALSAAHLDPTAPPPPPSIEDVTDAPDVSEEIEPEPEPVQDETDACITSGDVTTDSTAEQTDSANEGQGCGWRPSAQPSPQQLAEPQQAVAQRQILDESEDFITASECTCTPPSRSSSFHTASEGGVTSPWWELDPTSEEGGEEPHRARVTPSKASKQVQTMPLELDGNLPGPGVAAEQDETDGEREVLAGVVTQRQVTETRQLVVRRGGGETRASSELSCSRIEMSHLNGCNASTSSAGSATSTLSSGTRGALEAVLLPCLALDEDASSAAYREELEQTLPLPLPIDLPSPLAFADPTDPKDMPPPPQELLDGLKEVRDENANHLVVLEQLEQDRLDLDRLDLDTGSSSRSRFLCQPHILRHAIKGII